MKWKIRRALLSLSDRTGIEPLVRTLHDLGCEMITTGGTGRDITAFGLPVIDVSAVTGNPAAFGGRMKTLSFQLESALLFDRERDADEAAMLGIAVIASRSTPTDMAVKMCREAGITLLGYLRGGSFEVFSCKERVSCQGDLNVA